MNSGYKSDIFRYFYVDESSTREQHVSAFTLIPSNNCLHNSIKCMVHDKKLLNLIIKLTLLYRLNIST